MGVRIENDNDCVGCERCVGCGRGKYSYKVYECDGEGCNTDSEIEDIFCYNGEYFCKECFFDTLIEDGTLREIFDDMLDDICKDLDVVNVNG